MRRLLGGVDDTGSEARTDSHRKKNNRFFILPNALVFHSLLSLSSFIHRLPHYESVEGTYSPDVDVAHLLTTKYLAR